MEPGAVTDGIRVAAVNQPDHLPDLFHMFFEQVISAGIETPHIIHHIQVHHQANIPDVAALFKFFYHIFRTQQPLFFSHKEYEFYRAFCFQVQAFENTGDVHDRERAHAVIYSAGGQVPGVKVPADHYFFILMLFGGAGQGS
ncbi:hypothetical protein D9M69_679650 [compost metagenome]